MPVEQLAQLRHVRAVLLALILAPRPFTFPEHLRAMAELWCILETRIAAEEQRQREEGAQLFLDAVRAMGGCRGRR